MEIKLKLKILKKIIEYKKFKLFYKKTFMIFQYPKKYEYSKY